MAPGISKKKLKYARCLIVCLTLPFPRVARYVLASSKADLCRAQASYHYSKIIDSFHSSDDGEVRFVHAKAGTSRQPLLCQLNSLHPRVCPRHGDSARRVHGTPERGSSR